MAAAVGGLALLASAPRDLAAASAAAKPNIIAIVTDDQQLRSMWAMPRTMRRIGRRGVNFRQSFASFPLCCPSRATFLTGQYAHNHGVKSNAPPDGGLASFKTEDRTIAVALRRAGYRTGFVGKYLNGYPARVARDGPRRMPPGWDRWAAISRTGMFDWQLNDGGRLQRFGSLRRHYNTDVLARLAKRFISTSSARDEPFFLALMTFAPHSEPGLGRPRNPRPAPRHRHRFRNRKLPRPPSFNRWSAGKPSFLHRPRFERTEIVRLRARHRARMASLVAVDEMVAGVVRRLSKHGQLRNTYIIFTSDNGFMLGEHRRTKKTLLYEESARVPLLIRGPGIPKGRTLRRPLTANIDLAPTILDAAGADPLIEPDGVSLLDLFPGGGRIDVNGPAWTGRTILLEKLGGRPKANGAALRGDGYSYIRQRARGRTYEEYYNLRKDVFQLNNIFRGFRQPRKRWLRSRLDDLRQCQGHGPPPNKSCSAP